MQMAAIASGSNAFFISEGLGFGCCIFTGSCKDKIFNNEKSKANQSMFGETMPMGE